MKRRTTNLLSLAALAIAVSLVLSAAPALAQRGGGGVKTDSRILYHNGPVLPGTSDVYLIWYGNFSGDTTVSILTDLTSSIGSSPYFLINTTYPDANGNAPNGAVIYAGAVNDAYSHGSDLTALAIQGIVRDNLVAYNLPFDPAGIYIVLASADISSNSTGFCSPSAPPHHGVGDFNGAQFKYGFIGNPQRCPSVLVPQSPSPNDNIYADPMASTLAHLLDVIVTDPTGTGWFDRYGLENADKCQGTYGQTYAAANGSRANIRLGSRDYLIQQNWVNATRKGYCGLSNP